MQLVEEKKPPAPRVDCQGAGPADIESPAAIEHSSATASSNSDVTSDAEFGAGIPEAAAPLNEAASSGTSEAGTSDTTPAG